MRKLQFGFTSNGDPIVAKRVGVRIIKMPFCQICLRKYISFAGWWSVLVNPVNCGTCKLSSYSLTIYLSSFVKCIKIQIRNVTMSWAKKCDHEAAILSQAEDDIEDVDDVDVVVDFRVVKVVNEVRHGVEGDEGAGPADAG